jgi:hypothetical protein
MSQPSAKISSATPLDPLAKEFNPSSSTIQVKKTSAKKPVEYEQICIICSEKRTFFSVGICNHPICSICSLRMRCKSNDNSCTICKQLLYFVIVYNINKGQKLFESFGFDDIDARIPGMDIDHSSNMAFFKCSDHYKFLMNMRSFKCPIKSCNHSVRSNETLIKHFEVDHASLKLCSLCLEHRPIFFQEQEIFQTENQLKKHKKSWGFDGKGHPMCEFCKNCYFDSSHLYRHMNESHMTCHLCPLNMAQRFYRNTNSLSNHLSDCHFVCKHCERNGHLAAFTSHGAYSEHMLEVSVYWH